MKTEGNLTVYTQQEMLAEWKLRCGYVNGRRECTVERDDGIDIDSILLRRIDDAYARLLREAPPSLLPVADVAAECTPAIKYTGCISIALPGHCVRVLCIDFAGWQRPAIPVSADSPTARLQSVDWLRGGASCPVCVDEGDGTLTVFGGDSLNTVSPFRLMAVVRPDDGTYRFSVGLWPQLLSYTQPLWVQSGH